MISEEDYHRLYMFKEELHKRLIDFMEDLDDSGKECLEDLYDQDPDEKIFWYRKHLLTRHGLTASLTIELVEGGEE